MRGLAALNYRFHQNPTSRQWREQYLGTATACRSLEKEYGNERPNHPDGVAENAAAPEQ